MTILQESRRRNRISKEWGWGIGVRKRQEDSIAIKRSDMIHLYFQNIVKHVRKGIFFVVKNEMKKFWVRSCIFKNLNNIYNIIKSNNILLL